MGDASYKLYYGLMLVVASAQSLAWCCQLLHRSCSAQYAGEPLPARSAQMRVDQLIKQLTMFSDH